MFKPRLRTKLGCLTCRKRRKKCGLERPRCRSCSKLSLNCTWSVQSEQDVLPNTSLSSINISVAPALLCYQDGQLMNGWQSFHSQTQLQLTLACPKMISAILTLPDVEYSVLEAVQMSLLLSEPLIRSSMAAFASGMLCIGERSLETRSLKYYLDGIRDTKMLMQTGADNKQFAAKLVMMFFLGCREASVSRTST